VKQNCEQDAAVKGREGNEEPRIDYEGPRIESIVGFNYFDEDGKILYGGEVGYLKLLVHWENSISDEDEFFPILALYSENIYTSLVTNYIQKHGHRIELRKVGSERERDLLLAINPKIPEGPLDADGDETIIVSSGPGWTTRRNHSEQVESVGAWEAWQDAESGNIFYYNRDSRVSQWEMPEGWKAAHAHNDNTPDHNNTSMASAGSQGSATRNPSGIRRSRATWDEKVRHSSPTKKRKDGDWQQMVDDDTGETFYHNQRTGMSQWEDPAQVGERLDDNPQRDASDVVSIGPGWTTRRNEAEQVKTVGDWEEYVDPKSGAKFYYNHATNESQWEKPDDFETNNSNVEIGANDDDGIPRVHVGHGWTTRRNLSEEVQKQGVWHEYLDKESGEPFFYNETTGETQWEVPDGYEPLTSPTKSSVHLVDWGERRQRSSPIRTLSKNNILKDVQYSAGNHQHVHLETITSERTPSKSSNAESSNSNDGNGRKIDGDGIEWIEYYDAQSNQTFWHNPTTGESQWYAPSTTKGAKDDNAKANDDTTAGGAVGLAAKEEGGTRDSQQPQTLDMTASGGAWTLRRNASKQIMHVGDWEEYLDPDTQAKFYYNHMTGVSQWDRPKEMGSAAQPKASALSGHDSPAMETAVAQKIVLGTTEGGWTMRRAQSKQVMQLNDEWEEYYDNDQQSPFYYNKRTGACQWERPEAFKNGVSEHGHGSARTDSSSNSEQWNLRRENSVQVLAVGDWQIYRDPATDRTFYYNSKTQKSQWEAPNDAGLTPVPQTPDAFKATTPATTPGPREHHRPHPSHPESRKSKWERHEDAQSGKSYYYNNDTKESRWQRPDEFESSDDDDDNYTIQVSDDLVNLGV